MPADVPSHTSHSQVRTYLECPYRYFLERVEEHPQIPHVAAVAGKAFHTWSEHYDIGRPGRPWEDYLTAALVEEQEATQIDHTEFRCKKGEGIGWWIEKGPEFQAGYIAWRENTGWEIAYDLPPDVDGNTNGVEYGFSWEKLGQPHVGFIDRIFRFGDLLILVDVKTGARRATSQLYEYYAAARSCGIPINAVTYYFARSGKSDNLDYPDRWDDSRLASLVAPVQQAIAQGLFPPRISDACRYCPVRTFCSYVDPSCHEGMR